MTENHGARWMFYRRGVYGPSDEATIRAFTKQYGEFVSDESGAANVVFEQMWAEIDRLRGIIAAASPKPANSVPQVVRE
jgi:hypothetical protein